MKTLFRTIALIAVISLSCVCFSEESKEKDKAAKLESALHTLQIQKEELDRNQEELRRQLMELNRQSDEVQPIVPQMSLLPQTARTTRTSGIVLSSGQAGDSADISVVITSEDGQPERISQVTEDMGIMARILDKQVLEMPAPQPKQMTFGDRSFYYLRSEAPGEKTTRGIYISGYGALFLMEVDFPLRPQVKVEEKEEKKADVGDIWEQTKDELTGRYRRFGPEEREIKRDRRKAVFDESKVKELKEKIIKALKYASNIRGLEPDEKIIVAVKSVIHQGRGTIREINILGRQFGVQTGGGGGFGGGYDGGGGGGYAGGGYGGAFVGGGFSEEKELKSITGMTIIVEKGDVDSFAEGELDYGEFCEDVEIFEY